MCSRLFCSVLPVDSIQPANTAATAGATATTAAATGNGRLEPTVLEHMECVQPSATGWLGLQPVQRWGTEMID